jgi:two-component system, LytTR family, response regulator
LNINCLIVDDEPLARNLLTDYVRKVPYLNLIKACSGPLEAMEELRKNPVDLLFLDVQMPEITGISFLKSLQKKPLIILTTAYSQYALEGYELDVLDYLLKPITLERFLRAVDKVNQRLSTVPVVAKQEAEAPNNAYIFVKDGTKLVKVRFEDILYVEGLKDYVTIHTRQQKVISLQRMKVLEEQLPVDRFIRIHNSFIIALDAIDAVHKDRVQIGENFIPVGDTYKKSFRDFIEGKQMG